LNGLPDLFSEEGLAKADPSGVRAIYEKWPSLAKEGYQAAAGVPVKRFSKACVLGMGGSAAGGDVVAGWLSTRPGLEVEVYKGSVPARDMKGTLAIACSASGQTQETVNMMETAIGRGATVVSISSGGKLMEVSRGAGVPHIMMPRGAAPRYMLPFIVFACVSLLDRGLALGSGREVQESFAELDEERKAVGVSAQAASNPSKRLALDLLDATPAIYAGRVTKGVGLRFKNVLNENSKKHAHFDAAPDLFHNEIEAWEGRGTGFKPIFLRHSEDEPYDARRADRMISIISGLGVSPVEVTGRGRSSLPQLVTMAYRLDMVSYYVAVALGRDPLPTRLIDQLKS
jgi:glucose/mannose-6-phosphate isomerase